jgi:predicted transcriptional regulator
MNIQTEKLHLIEWIASLEDQAIVEKLRRFRDECFRYGEDSDTLKKEELESINRGLKDFEEGRFYSHEEVRNVYEKFL